MVDIGNNMKLPCSCDLIRILSDLRRWLQVW